MMLKRLDPFDCLCQTSLGLNCLALNIVFGLVYKIFHKIKKPKTNNIGSFHVENCWEKSIFGALLFAVIIVIILPIHSIVLTPLCFIIIIIISITQRAQENYNLLEENVFNRH